MNERIQLIEGDITKVNCDAVVNAANSSLLGGGGVDGAIHRAAGPELLNECRALNGCKTGAAKITGAYRLPSKFVIHTVGPVWRGGNANENDLLASCYRTSLQLAVSNNCKNVAFPNVSAGIYGFPKMMAATIALREVEIFLENNALPEKVIFCCFDTENYKIYKQLLS